MDGADDAFWPRCFLVSSSPVCKTKFYLNNFHVENVGSSKIGDFLNTL